MIDFLEPYRQWCGQLKQTSKGGFVALCPSHNDTKPSLQINPTDSGNYVHHCYPCGEKGDSYIVAKDYLSLSDSSKYAIHGVKKQKIEPYTNNILSQNSTKRDVADLLQESVVKQYHETLMDNIELLDWTISKQTIIDFQLGYDPKQEKIVLPIRNAEGGVLTLKTHKGHYLPYDVKTDKENKFFPLDKIKGYDKKKTLIICGGEKDCIVGIEHLGWQFATVTGGEGSIPKAEHWIPIQNFNRYIILYDNDTTGKEGAEKIAKAIHNLFDPKCDVRIAQWDKSLPNKWDIADAVKQSRADTIHQAIDDCIAVEPSFNDGMMTDNITQNNEIEELEHMSFGELLKSDFKAPEIIIHEILQEKSVSIIGGCSGIGKSWIGLNFGICVATGRPLFNHFEIVKPRKVLLVQFELDNGQVKERCEKLAKDMSEDEQRKASENFDYIILKSNQSFTDRWDAIDYKLSQGSWGVLIVDNLYSSVDTGKDLSNNQDLMTVIAKIDTIKEKHKIASTLLTHHKKGLKKAPIDMDDILGGATLTRYASNIFQIKNSLRDTNWRVAMITKVRGEESHLVEIPFILKFNSGWFEKGEVISKEILHYVDEKERWEVGMVKEMKSYESARGLTEWTRDDLWKFLSTKDTWERTPSNETKVSRFIAKCVSWGLMERSHNKYIIKDSDLIG